MITMKIFYDNNNDDNNNNADGYDDNLQVWLHVWMKQWVTSQRPCRRKVSGTIQ